jgi:hypothetical protein
MLLKSIILPSMEEEEEEGKNKIKSSGAKASMLECAEPGAAAGARVHTLRKRQGKGSLGGLSR